MEPTVSHFPSPEEAARAGQAVTGGQQQAKEASIDAYITRCVEELAEFLGNPRKSTHVLGFELSEGELRFQKVARLAERIISHIPSGYNPRLSETPNTSRRVSKEERVVVITITLPNGFPSCTEDLPD